ILNLKWQTRRNAIHIKLVGMSPLRFQEKLMLFFFGKAHDFVFNRGTIARAGAFDFSGIHRRFIEIVANDLVSSAVRVGNPTRNLFHVKLSVFEAVECENLIPAVLEQFRQKAERGRWLITELLFTRAEVN